MKIGALIVASMVFGVALGNGGEQKLLSMEDAILNRNLIPQSYSVYFNANYPECYIHREGDKLLSIDIKKGTQTEITLPKKNNKAKAKLNCNNITWIDANGEEKAVTNFADKNIVCGQSVSRNEFGISGGLFISPDSTRLAFYQKDESRVTDFPLLDITTRTGSLKSIKYPMNGMDSEIVSVGVYDSTTNKTIYLNINDFDKECYKTCLTWSPDSKSIYLQVLDRPQKNMHLNCYDATTGKQLSTLLEEHNDRFVEPSVPLHFIDNNRFIYSTDNRDGYKNLYLYCLDNKSLERITKVEADVAYIAHCGTKVFYYSAQISPAEQHLFVTDIRNGKTLQLTKQSGWHNCRISPNGKYFSDNYSSLLVPRIVGVGSTDGKIYKELFTAPDPSADYNYCPIELGSIKSADGRFDNFYRLIRPIDFDPNKKYPVIVYVYGGPHSQMVTNSFQAQLRRWEMYMAQRGYVVFVMDNRGTLNHGAEYEKAIHRHCGVAEMADQMEGIKFLKSFSWVDSERIGVHGWSYGGFMTISLITTYPDVFKVGVAGGPVIDWKWYEVMYGERYMDTPQTNPEGFAEVSLINKAKNLKGKLLICQGAIDNTVVWQHSLSFVNECIKNNIQLDYFPYPVAEHNVMGKDRVHLMQKVTDYFDQNLK